MRLVVARAGAIAAGGQALLSSSRWSCQRLEQYQLDRLRALVSYAFHNVPFYRDLYSKAGVRPEQIARLDDIRRLPTTSRHDLQSFSESELTVQGLRPDRMVVKRTSGMTGEPLAVRRTPSEERLLTAFRFRVLRAWGLRPWDLSASAVFITEESRRPATRMGVAGLYPRLRLHCVLPAEELARLFLAARPAVMGGYPNILRRVAEYIPARGALSGLKFLVTGAEVLSEGMRSELTEKFGVLVCDRYGAHESRMIAFSCPRYPEMYHLSEDSVFVEVLKDGSPVGPGGEGEIFVTPLYSFAMPFIRYRLGDLVRRGEAGCPCGSCFGTLSAIAGRVFDRFVRPDGTELHVTAITFPLRLLAPWLLQSRIVQEVPERIVVEVVARPGVRAEDAAEVGRKLSGIVGQGVHIAVELRDSLPQLTSGKSQLYYSTMNRSRI